MYEILSQSSTRTRGRFSNSSRALHSLWWDQKYFTEFPLCSTVLLLMVIQVSMQYISLIVSMSVGDFLVVGMVRPELIFITVGKICHGTFCKIVCSVKNFCGMSRWSVFNIFVLKLSLPSMSDVPVYRLEIQLLPYQSPSWRRLHQQTPSRACISRT